MRSSIAEPVCKWGSVSHKSVGKVVKLPTEDSLLCTVDFDTQEGWTGDIYELEKAPGIHTNFRYGVM